MAAVEDEKDVLFGERVREAEASRGSAKDDVRGGSFARDDALVDPGRRAPANRPERHVAGAKGQDTGEDAGGDEHRDEVPENAAQARLIVARMPWDAGSAPCLRSALLEGADVELAGRVEVEVDGAAHGVDVVLEHRNLVDVAARDR